MEVTQGESRSLDYSSSMNRYPLRPEECGAWPLYCSSCARSAFGRFTIEFQVKDLGFTGFLLRNVK